MAEYPRRDKLTGDAPGCEHQGKPSPPMREAGTSELEVLLGCPVDPRLGWQECQPESVCITHNPKIHAPTFKPKESLA